MFLSKLFSFFKKKPTDKAVEGPALSGKAQTSIPGVGTAVGGAVGATQDITSQKPQPTASNDSPISMPEPGSSVAMSTPDGSPSSDSTPPTASSEPTSTMPVDTPETPTPETSSTPETPITPEEPVSPPSEPVNPPVESPTEPVQPPEDPTQPSGLV